MGLIDGNEVWEAALGIYDLSLAALVARLSGKVLRLLREMGGGFGAAEEKGDVRECERGGCYSSLMRACVCVHEWSAGVRGCIAC